MKLMCKIVLFSLTFLVGFNANAQVAWGGTTENQVFNFGFLFQGVSSEYKILKTANWNQQYVFDALSDVGTAQQSETYPLANIYAEPKWGGGLGFLASYNPSNRVSFRLTPSYIFSDRRIRYGFNLSAPSAGGGGYYYTYDKFEEQGITGVAYKTIKSTAIDFPLDFKLKSDRVGNFGGYFLLGTKYTMDLGAEKNLKDRILTGEKLQNTVYTQPNYFSYAAGFGVTYYFDFFKLSAEVKYNQSFNNLNIADNNLWSRPIEKIYMRSLNFSLIFE